MTAADIRTDVRPIFPEFSQDELSCNVQTGNPPQDGRAPECGKTPAWPVETLCQVCESTGENNMCKDCLEQPLMCANCFRLNGHHHPLTVFRM